MVKINVKMARRQPTIVIIGAGIAGIAAADCLQKAGLTNYKVLEATTRTGGRIHTQWFGEGKHMSMVSFRTAQKTLLEGGG